MDDRNDGQWTVLMLMMMTDAQHGIKLRMAGGSGRMGIGQDTYATVINKLGLWWRHTHNVQFVIRMRNDEFISTSTFHPSILDQLHMLCLRRDCLSFTDGAAEPACYARVWLDGCFASFEWEMCQRQRLIKHMYQIHRDRCFYWTRN